MLSDLIKSCFLEVSLPHAALMFSEIMWEGVGDLKNAYCFLWGRGSEVASASDSRSKC